MSLNEVALSLQLDAAIDSDETGNFDGEAVYDALRGIGISGDVSINSGGYRFNGDAAFEMTRLNDDARLFAGTDFEGSVLAPKSARLSGEFISADGSIRFNATGSVNLHNAATFDTFNWLNYTNNSVFLNGQLTESDVAQFREWFMSEDSLYTDNIYVGEWPFESYLYSNMFVEDESKSNSVTVDITSEAAQQRVENTLVDAIPGDFSVSFIVAADEGQEPEQTVLGSEVLEGATLTSFNVATGNAIAYFMVDSASISSNEILYVEGMNSGEHVYTQAWLDTDSVYIAIEWSPSEHLLTSMAEETQHPLAAFSQAERFDLSEASGWSVDMSVPEVSMAYDYCVENPEEWFGYFVDQAQYECAWGTLSYDSVERTLTDADREKVSQLIESKLSARLGDSVPYEVIGRAAAYYDAYDFVSSDWVAEIAVQDTQSSDYHLQGSITASLGITLPELPAAQLTTTFNRTGQYAGSVRANVDWDGGNYALDIAGSDLDNPEALDLRFFNAQGYELSLAVSFAEGEVTNLTGEASIDGEAVGDVEWRDGQPVLVFQDGEETEIQSLF